jgi:hypothetical protein
MMSLFMPITLLALEGDLDTDQLVPDGVLPNAAGNHCEVPQRSAKGHEPSALLLQPPAAHVGYPSDCEAPVPTAKLMEEAKLFSAAMLFIFGVSLSISFLSYGIVQGKFGSSPAYEFSLVCIASACLGYGLHVMLDTVFTTAAA